MYLYTLKMYHFVPSGTCAKYIYNIDRCYSPFTCSFYLHCVLVFVFKNVKRGNSHAPIQSFIR